jgi:superfamily II DNA or RNA helicase
MKPYVYDGVYIKNPSKALKDEFTFYISDYKNNTKEYKLYDYERKSGVYKFPFGAVKHLEEFDDKRIEIPLTITLKNAIQLRDYQKNVVDKLENPIGVLFSEPGSGKTVMACELIARKKVTTLILVPTLYLLNQWKERIETFLGITPGVLGDGRKDIQEITVSTFPSALNNLDLLKERFSFIIIDETHRIAATSYRNVVHNLPAKYKLGVTGTLERKDKLEFMVYAYLSKNIVRNDSNPSLTPGVVIVKIPLTLRGKTYVEALNFISANESILNVQTKWMRDLYNTRFQLGLSLRVAHIHNLSDMLSDCPHKVVTGATPSADRDGLNNNLMNDRIILATNVLDEGADLDNLDTLHLLVPTNNIPKLIQRLNRVTRFKEGKKNPLIFDYWFTNCVGNWSVIKQQQARLRFYNEKGYKVYVR